MAIRREKRLITLLAATWLVLPAVAAAEDEALARAKDLYLSASYEDALTILDSLPTQSSPDGMQVSEYRVFCLLALNRRAEAQKAIEALVTAHPSYRPSEADASPRILSVFLEVRQRFMTSMVQAAYADAKAAFDRRDPHAAAMFERVLDLLADPDIAPSMSDLRTVATGFRDLSWATAGTSGPRASGESGGATTTPLPSPTPSAPPTASAPTRQSSSATGGTAATGKDAVSPAPARPTASGASRAGSSTPAAAKTGGTSSSSEQESGVVPPEVIYQPMPGWTPANSFESTQTFRGSLELTIDDHGNVVTARMRRPAHARYDEQLIKAAQTWKFKPARRDGVSIPYLRIVEIELRPYQ